MKTLTNKCVFSQRSLSVLESGVTFSPQGKYLDCRGVLVICPGVEGCRVTLSLGSCRGS